MLCRNLCAGHKVAACLISTYNIRSRKRWTNWRFSSWLMFSHVSVLDRRNGHVWRVYSAKWGSGWRTVYLERVAFEPDRDYKAGCPPCMSVSAIEGATWFAAYPVWTSAVYTQYLQGDTKPDVPGWLQSQIMGLQLLLSKESSKYFAVSKHLFYFESYRNILIYWWTVVPWLRAMKGRVVLKFYDIIIFCTN